MQYSEHQIYFSNVEIGKIIDFQIINFTRPEGGDNTSSISPTDNAVKLFIWKSIEWSVSFCVGLWLMECS